VSLSAHTLAPPSRTDPDPPALGTQKLGARTEARAQLAATTHAAFRHATFEPALQLECMSDEDSDGDGGDDGALAVRGRAWRSARPRRGAGRRVRAEGGPAAASGLPPPGVARWMLSRRWLAEMRRAEPEAHAAAQARVCAEDDGFDWTAFDELGYESAEEAERVPGLLEGGWASNSASYSLQDALVPVH
jgi:hypothetical protein